MKSELHRETRSVVVSLDPRYVLFEDWDQLAIQSCRFGIQRGFGFVEADVRRSGNHHRSILLIVG